MKSLAVVLTPISTKDQLQVSTVQCAGFCSVLLQLKFPYLSVRDTCRKIQNTKNSGEGIKMSD